jgi:hypothetical protein
LFNKKYYIYYNPLQSITIHITIHINEIIYKKQ